MTFVDRTPFDFDKVREQHVSYEELLKSLSVHVISLDAEEELPDSVFVEDIALVLDECVVVFSKKVESRQGESKAIEPVLSEYRTIFRINSPAFVDGGDILTNNKTIFAGISTRTTRTGFTELKNLLKPLGYNVLPVHVNSALHLKTACSFLNEDTVILNPNWIDREVFRGFKIVEVDDTEPFAANVLRIGNSVLMHSGFSKTVSLARELGFDVLTTDISEFQKAEAGLTCLSLVFEA